MESKINHLLQEAKACFYNAKDVEIIITLPKEDMGQVGEEIKKMLEYAFPIGKVPDNFEGFNVIQTPDGKIRFKTDGE